MDLETIQTLLDLLNPLHGSLDRQTYNEKDKQDFDAPPDCEYAVDVTAQQERDLTQAVLILEDRKRQALAPKPRPTIAELDALLNSEGDAEITINPDGSITALTPPDRVEADK